MSVTVVRPLRRPGADDTTRPPPAGADGGHGHGAAGLVVVRLVA
ncbi:hypothetical protein [Nocardia otitidiscaviarum]|nr:hypothetical protein [Nocardia otitidiscaviarum]